MKGKGGSPVVEEVRRSSLGTATGYAVAPVYGHHDRHGHDLGYAREYSFRYGYDRVGYRDYGSKRGCGHWTALSGRRMVSASGNDRRDREDCGQVALEVVVKRRMMPSFPTTRLKVKFPDRVSQKLNCLLNYMTDMHKNNPITINRFDNGVMLPGSLSRPHYLLSYRIES